MGFVFAVILGLYLGKIFCSKLYAGRYSLKQTFWGFGVFGGSIVLILAGAYVAHVMQGDNSAQGGWTLAAVRAVGAPAAVYAFVVFVGIWRSASDSTLLIKILTRYCSLFLLSTAAGFVLFSWFNLLIALVVFMLKKNVGDKKQAKTLEVKV